MRGHDVIERMRDGAFVRFGTTALQGIRSAGTIIGFGLVVERHPHGGAIAINTDVLNPMVEKVRRALGMRGVGGEFTINIEETDPPMLPTRLAS
jgi:hypothetical protein